MISTWVHTPSKSYPIHIQAGLLQHLSEHLPLKANSPVAIISNVTVAPLYLKTVQHALDQLQLQHFTITLPDGECHKNWETLNLIFDGLLQNHAERSTTLIALGGGVIGDMVGFAAACYQRGIPFIQIPTTLLSQVDSSVGGKTAINHPLGKNMIGAFYQPEAVFIDLDTLKTLPEREFSAGLAEIIKYALLGNLPFLTWLENNIDTLMALDTKALSYTIQTCCEMKAAIVNEDEKEQGKRALLNLGHTFAHAIEAEMGYGVWLHGEAVACGLVMACRLSEELGHLSAKDTERVIHLLNKAKLPTKAPQFSTDKWIAHMQHDKKVAQGTIRFIALHALGDAYQTGHIDPRQIEQAILATV